jgi:hypothetical protein
MVALSLFRGGGMKKLEIADIVALSAEGEE